MAGEERFFSSEPVGFRMDQKSAAAAELLDDVSKKLVEFLGDYSDEVLAKYIVVLVCNGKHQIQARDDLEAFLGDDTGRFVAWLWDHLSKQNRHLKMPCYTSNLKAEVRSSRDDVSHKEHTTNGFTYHTHSAGSSDIKSSKDQKHGPPYPNTNSSYVNNIEVPENLERWCPTTEHPLTEVDNESLRTNNQEIDKDSGASDCRRATKYLSSSVICSPEILSGGEQCLHYDYQHQKIAKSNPNAVQYRPSAVPKTEVARNRRSVTSEDRQLMPSSTRNVARLLPSASADVVAHEMAQRRGNVWDRLGKPSQEDDAEMRERKHRRGLNLIKREKVNRQEEELQNCRLACVGGSAISGSSHDKSNADHHFDESRMEEDSYHTVGNINVSSYKRKRRLGEFDAVNSSASFSGCKENLVTVKEAPLKQQGSLPVKYNRLHTVNEVTSGGKGLSTSSGPACYSPTPASIHPGSQANKKSLPLLDGNSSATTPTQNLVPVRGQLPSQSEPYRHSESSNAGNRPVHDEVVDVKLRLRQVEMDMLRLRSKQAELSNETKLNASSGVQNHCEDDIESRTVLVTNVHFAASREALSSYFSKCGGVVKVVMLTDTITAQPKGAAYVVFASKSSVDQAVSLTGTSFFSRLLKVMRKADMPPGFLVPTQPGGRHSQPFFSQPYRTGAVQKQYVSPHLQWRRDQPASGENPLSANANGLESSNAK